MHKTAIGLMIVLNSLTGFAEKIDGPANIRNTEKGETIFSLKDNVEVETIEPKNGWFNILVSIKLTKEQYESKSSVLTKGSKLYNNKGEEIGIVIKDFSFSSKMTGGGAAGVPKWYAGEIHGYTFKTNIKPESIIEPAISNLIESNKTNLTFLIFKDHMKYFGYVEGLKIKDMDNLKTYMVYESTLDDPSPLDRIRLIFEGENLIAVVHSRNLTVTNFETVPIERERKLTLTGKFTPENKAKFIAKNKQSYSGID
jgi:hypothetical protein